MSLAAERLYTPSEAAVLSDIGVKAVNNAIDKRVVRIVAHPASPRGEKQARRSLTSQDLLWLKLWYGIGETLSQERRERLFDAIRHAPTARTVKADDLLIIDVAEARKQIAARTRDLTKAEAMVERRRSVMGNEPVFKGTRIPVRLIASMLADGTSEDEILEGYPKLDRHKLALTQLWVAAHPRRGRPKTLKDRGMKPKTTRRTSLKGEPRPSGPDAA